MSAPRNRVLVTGGAGFVGANLVRLLLSEGYGVTVLDNLSVGDARHLDGLPVELVAGDILDAELVMRTVAGHQAVVHLAAQTGITGSVADPRRDSELNIGGTLNMLEAVRAAQDAAPGRRMRFLYASSNATLGRQPQPASEEKAPLPISPYGASKLAGEAYCLAYHGTWGLGTLVLRFGNVYGPFSGHKESVVAKYIEQVRVGETLSIYGDGTQTRDFVYVGDICRAILRGLESETSGEIFQIATGVETSILRLVELVREVVGRDVDATHEPARAGDMEKNYSAVAKARQVLGWEPEMELKRGLELTWQWFASNEANRAPVLGPRPAGAP